RGRAGSLRRVPEAILVSQLVIDFIEHFFDRRLLRNFKKTAAGLAPQTLHHLFAELAAIAAHAAPRSAAVVSAPTRVSLFVGEKNRVAERIRPLRLFDRLSEIHLAPGVHPIGEHNQRLTPALLFHQLGGGEPPLNIKRRRASDENFGALRRLARLHHGPDSRPDNLPRWRPRNLRDPATLARSDPKPLPVFCAKRSDPAAVPPRGRNE